MTDTLLGSLAPVNNDALDSGLTLGTRIKFNANRRITKVRWYFPNTLPSNTVPWTIWVYNPVDDTAGSVLGSGTFSATPNANQWNEVSVGTPINRATNDEIVVAVWSATRYVATLNFFGADVPSVNGDLTGPADFSGSPNRRNGRFRSGGSLLYPSSGSNKSCYFVDIEVEEIPSAVTGTFQATAPSPVLAAGGGLINPGAYTASSPGGVLLSAGGLINPGAAVASISGFALSAAGGLVNPSTFQGTGPPGQLSAYDQLPGPGIATPSGSTVAPTASGRTDIPVASGRP